jgi:hypothetical protein
MVVPRNGWFIITVMVNPMKMKDLGVPPLLRKPPYEFFPNPLGLHVGPKSWDHRSGDCRPFEQFMNKKRVHQNWVHNNP